MTEGRTAWIFPGQGSQDVGMGRDLYDASPAARALFDRADEVLGRPLSRLCFEGPADALGATSNAQPAIYVMSLACLTAAREAGPLPAPAFVAGHSLGEYTALAAVNAFSFEDGLQLVAQRGRLTEEAAKATPGGMAAILGLDEDLVQALCTEAGAEVCNINAPGQIVIGGREDALARAMELASARGARRAVRLDVAGAFHTSLMGSAVEAFGRAVSSTEMRAPEAPFVANDGGRPLTDPVTIAEELVHQLTHPVQWVRCVRFLASEGVTHVIELGPGRVLTGLVKRIAPEIGLRNINDAATARA